MQINKAQAERLLQTIDTNAYSKELCGRNAYYKDDILKAISQCTEKEFPEYSGTWSCPNGGGILQLRTCINKRYIFLKQDDKYQLSMEQHEFKQFTEGCNKIVEWINEQ